jgi:hypothetical protein
MWTQDDDGNGMTWPQALNYAENAIFSGYDDWRLPNAKELQSLLDYTRSPSTSNSAAIDPLFHCTPITDEGGNVNYPFYWTGTTHASWQEDAPGGYGAYVCFGEALGWMEEPPQSGNYLLMDVHGAGAQRSDPKTGDPSEWPHGNGPQGDVIRIYNYVRLVRDADGPTGYDEINNNNEQMEIYPNPTSGFLTINNPEKTDGKLYIFDANGILFHESETGNENKVQLNISNYPSGLFIVRFVQTSNTSCKSFIKN